MTDGTLASTAGYVITLARDNPDVSHHPAVLMFENMTVVYEIAHLGERYRHFDRLNLTSFRTPGVDSAVARVTAVGHRDIVN